MTVIGEVDTVLIAKKLKKFGKIDVVSVGPAKEEKKDDKKEGNKWSVLLPQHRYLIWFSLQDDTQCLAYDFAS